MKNRVYHVIFRRQPTSYCSMEAPTRKEAIKRAREIIAGISGGYDPGPVKSARKVR